MAEQTAGISTTLQNAIDKYQHIIWDWNGTLLDDVDNTVQVTNILLARQGLAPTDRKQYTDIFEFPVRSYYDKMGFDYELQSFESLCADFNEGFIEGLENCNLRTGAREVLAAIRESGKKQSILSASEQKRLRHMVRQFGIEGYFDFIIGQDNQLAGSKIERGRQLFRQAGTDPHLTVMIGDTIHDLDVGRALGIDVILLSGGHQSPEILRARHHDVIDSLI